MLPLLPASGDRCNLASPQPFGCSASSLRSHCASFLQLLGRIRNDLTQNALERLATGTARGLVLALNPFGGNLITINGANFSIPAWRLSSISGAPLSIRFGNQLYNAFSKLLVTSFVNQ
jgi:hypothetical protein